MPDTKFGSFEDLLNITEESQRAICVSLRETILEIDPDACEVVRLGDRAATYGMGPKKMSEGYAYVLPYKSWVNLGFYKGADLPDPEAALEGTGAKMRHVKVRSLEQAKEQHIKDLIGAALAERQTSLGR